MQEKNMGLICPIGRSGVNYNTFYQTGKCPGYSHITYVHDSFLSEAVHIYHIFTYWVHLTVHITDHMSNSKKYPISKICRPPNKFVVELDLVIDEFAEVLVPSCNFNRFAFVHVCGDFSINVLDINSNKHVSEY